MNKLTQNIIFYKSIEPTILSTADYINENLNYMSSEKGTYEFIKKIEVSFNPFSSSMIARSKELGLYLESNAPGSAAYGIDILNKESKINSIIAAFRICLDSDFGLWCLEFLVHTMNDGNIIFFVEHIENTLSKEKFPLNIETEEGDYIRLKDYKNLLREILKIQQLDD